MGRMTRFNTGRPCHRGHYADRYEASGKCVACIRENSAKWERENRAKKSAKWQRHYLKHVAHQKARSAAWRQANPALRKEAAKRDRARNHDAYLTRLAKWVALNRERYNAVRAEWRRKHPEVGARWRAAHPDVVAHLAAKRRAAKHRATPSWLTHDQLALVRAIYADARRMTRESGVRHHVDHIVPLRAQTVCGLHVPWNLAVIPAIDNHRKSNRHGADSRAIRTPASMIDGA